MKINTLQLAVDIGFSYLKGGHGKWVNNKDETLELKSMSREYLDNCIRFIDKGIKEIERGDIDDILKKKIKKLEKGKIISEEYMTSVKSDMVKVLENKKNEINRV